MNSVILLTEVSYGVAINFQNKSKYMNSFYFGSGDIIISSWGDDPETYHKQYMFGWVLKKEWGANFGYFLNLGLDFPEKLNGPFPKGNLGIFFLPGF